MHDDTLFSATYSPSRQRGKPAKRLLRKSYHKRILSETRAIAKRIKRRPHVTAIYIGGSLLQEKLGKYKRPWGGRDYSDIDLFIEIDSPLYKYTTLAQLRRIGLTKRRVSVRMGGKTTTFYKTYAADARGKPIHLLERFPVTAWLISPYSKPRDLKKFPRLLEGTIKI